MQRTEIAARWAVAALMLALLLAGGCGGEQADNAAETVAPAPERPDEEVRADFNDTMAAYRAEKDQEKKFQIWFDFLERNQNSGYTVGTLDYLAKDYYAEHMDDLAGGIAFVEDHLPKLGEKWRERGDRLLIELYGMAGDIDKLREMATETAANGSANYGIHISFANAAADAEAWDFAFEQAKAAYESATPEAIQAGTPEHEFTEAELTSRVNSQKGEALTTLGNAQLNSGDIEAALASFSEAEQYVMFNYVGVPSSDINIYWAKALIANGEYDAAMRRIAPDAIMQGHAKSMEIFKEAYEKSGGEEAGLERAINGMRAELARPVEDFQAYTYDGEKVAYSSLKGKVTLLAFWFPT